jgi:hypothetical protein
MFQKYIGTPYIILLDKEKNIYLDVILVDFTNRNLFFTDKKSNYVLDLQSNEISKIQKKTTGQLEGNDDFDKKQHQLLIKSPSQDEQKQIEKSKKERDNYLKFIGNKFLKPGVLIEQEGGNLEYRDKFHKYYHSICDPTSIFFHETISKYFSKTTQKTVKIVGHDQYYIDMYDFYKDLNIPNSSLTQLSKVKQDLTELLSDLQLCFDERMIFTFSIINYLDEAHDNHYKTLGYRIKITNVLLDKINNKLNSTEFGNDKWLWDTKLKNFTKIEDLNPKLFESKRIELFNKMPNDIRENIKKEEKNRKKYKMNTLNIPDTQLKSIEQFKPKRIRIDTLISRPSSKESIQSPWKRTPVSTIDSLESMFSQEEFPEIK